MWASGDAFGPADARIKAPTLASVVARHIEDEVVDAGWPVGTVLGSESDLLVRYGVSRAVLREAVRIVEHNGVAHMRRGPGGGLVVARPSRDALVAAVGVWCSSVGITMAEIFELRRPLLLSAVGLAAEQATAGQSALVVAEAAALGEPSRLRLEDLSAIESLLAGFAGDPVLQLFIDSLADLATNRLRGGWAQVRPRFTRAELEEHADGYRRLAAAVAGGEVGRAIGVMSELIDLVMARVVDPRRAPSPRRIEAGNGKLAEQVAAALRDDIERAGWPVGSVLGSETELIELHRVSRAVLREAVRILEHHGAVRTKRGPHGGLVVTAPDRRAIRRASLLYLEYEGVTPAGLSAIRESVEVAVARLAAARVTPEKVARLRAAVQGQAAAHDSSPLLALHRELAVCSDNRLAGLFVDILSALVPPHIGAAPGPETLEGARRAHRRIVDAIEAGDLEAAARRMQRHVRASTGVLQ